VLFKNVVNGSAGFYNLKIEKQEKENGTGI